MFHDQPPTSERDQTIRLSRKDLLAARRLLQLLLGAEGEHVDALDAPPQPHSRGAVDRAGLLARARVEFDNRRRRTGVFGRSMFGEAAWDMLLALYILDLTGQRHTVGNLLRFSGTPMTTAKRWLDYLAAHDLVWREPHPTDRRTAFVSLTAKARQKLDLYLSGATVAGA